MRAHSFAPVIAALILGTHAFAAGPANSQTLDIAPLPDRLFPSAPPRADLTVNITAPAHVYVGEPGVYQVAVANVGRRTANAVQLTVALPRTNTSPTVHILGTVDHIDSRCVCVGTNLVCTLGTLGARAATTVSFTIALPQSSAPLVVGASVTTTSVEQTTSNNTDSDTAHLLHPLVPVSVGDNAHVRHCTGTGLTSFFECELYPSSISSHDFQFLSGGVIAFIGAPPSYHGTWSQSAGDDRLLLEYYDGTSREATFDGYAVDDKCFEGVTVFYPAGPYVSPYRVCLP